MTDVTKLLADVLKVLLLRDQSNTCQHESTHRGGLIWEICDSCGCKWADDRGGKPEWEDPPVWAKAEAALEAYRQQSCDLGPICLGCEPKDECKPTGWMSIETAPKDGSSVLLYGENRCITGYWDRDQRWTDSAYGTMWDFDATHWMLLPPAPEKS